MGVIGNGGESRRFQGELGPVENVRLPNQTFHSALESAPLLLGEAAVDFGKTAQIFEVLPIAFGFIGSGRKTRRRIGPPDRIHQIGKDCRYGNYENCPNLDRARDDPPQSGWAARLAHSNRAPRLLFSGLRPWPAPLAPPLCLVCLFTIIT